MVQYSSNLFKEKSNDILDLGCGTGNLTHMLVPLGNVIGMDLSVDMLTIANQKSNEVRWLEGDMTSFKLNQNSISLQYFVIH